MYARSPRRGGPRERAVVADVPAELRQRDEDLRRERDERSLAARAELLGGAEQRRCVESGERQRIRSVEPLAEASLRQSCRCPCHGRWIVAAAGTLIRVREQADPLAAVYTGR